MAPLLTTLLTLLLIQYTFLPQAHGYGGHAKTCRSYCGNITIDYPFGLQPGCGHPAFRDLLFCFNDVLMFHISSGSYRVLNVDYAYQALTLHEPHLSTCKSVSLGGRGNGFVVEPWRRPYFTPAGDNVFMLIRCSAESPLFQGFPTKNLPCRNVSGMGCEEYYGCPGWNVVAPKRVASTAGPPECCAVAFEAIKSVNLTRLECEGYSSAYSLSPVRLEGAEQWSYGIRVKYSLQGNEAFCRACEATGGSCGYDTGGAVNEVCICGSWNSTSNCDSSSSVHSTSNTRRPNLMGIIEGFLVCMTVWRLGNLG
ncbi:uncharacterized protein LOC127795358 [Diospyros lotus]|uniref:uncharacterized protein LOC127795358 n=1 Tax=Diospyros lotus TaxID=55363 RepID=UPI002257F3CE|nr:uncharacterized protein LOC127795358 [Diospyros lotus]